MVLPNLDILTLQLRQEGPVILLESQAGNHPSSRFSYLAARPEASIKAFGTCIITETPDGRRQSEENPWDALARFADEQKRWLFGYLGYDLKNSIENLHSDNTDRVGAPDLFFFAPGLLLRMDHKQNRFETLNGEWPAVRTQRDSGKYQVGELQVNTDRRQYLLNIEKAQQAITEGEYYEINLSHQLSALFKGDSFGLYRRMRNAGPVPFGAYLSTEEWDVCCQSPERFLCRKGSHVFSQPIKGTIQRGKDPDDDRELQIQLRQSVKEQAENLMIVDLVRNDLSKIARKGSVRVSELFEIQTFDTVHQMVSTIEAETDEENSIEIIKACYPMGSMTGAPKISAMEAIDALERYRRGIYSGAIGYINPEGDFDFNVVIRTAIISGGELFYPVGGAITGDSDPEAEWEETMVKARALTNIL